MFRSYDYEASDIENPGNNLYVTGLSARITKRDVEKHFSAEGKVSWFVINNVKCWNYCRVKEL